MGFQHVCSNLLTMIAANRKLEIQKPNLCLSIVFHLRKMAIPSPTVLLVAIELEIPFNVCLFTYQQTSISISGQITMFVRFMYAMGRLKVC